MTKPAEINDAMRKGVTSAIQALFPLKSSDGKTELRVSNVKTSGDFNIDGRNAHQDAREHGKTLSENITADLEMVRDGRVVQAAAGLKIGELPLQTSLGSFVVKGGDYFAPLAQLRLKPGAYTRRAPAGHFETFIPMKGASMTVWMDPAKGVFKIGQGSTNVSWYPIVRALGASDTDILNLFGGDKAAREILEMNRITNSDKDIDKLYESMNRLKVDRDLVKGNIIEKPITGSLDATKKIMSIDEWLKAHALDPFVTKKTLGKPITDAGLAALMASAGKILEVQRSQAEPDDVDAPEFKTAHSISDLLPERLTRYSKYLTRKAERRLGDPDAKIRDIISTTWVDPLTTGYFGGGGGLDGGLAHTAEAANPLAILSENSKLTVMGEGGIQNDHAITLGARLFRPTATNFVDSVHTPEKEVGVMTHAARTVEVKDKQMTALYFNVRNGNVDRKTPVRVSVETASESVIGFPEYWDKDGKPTAAMVRAIKNGKIQEVPARDVQYVIPSGANTFDATSNSALFFSNTHPNRGMMAGKHLTQALPLVERETPLVKLVGEHTGEDMYDVIGHKVAVLSTVSGTVTKVTDEGIWVDGKEHQLFNRYPMQAKVALHHFPIVKVGDVVKKGQVIADSNYTRNGTLALGVNLRSAYTPWKNASNFEDAIVIDESAAKQLTSEHTHRIYKEKQEGEEIDAKMFAAQFPTKMTARNMQLLDSSGVVKEGVEVQPGDVLIAGLRKREFNTDDKSAKNLANVHKLLQRPWSDDSEVWSEDFVGKVQKVVRVGKTITIHILTHEPARVGDKLSMSSAAKGTISEVVPTDRMPTNEKGEPIQVIFNPHGVAGRINPSQTLEQAVGKLARDAGVKYEHSLFDGVDHAREIDKLLDKHGLRHDEYLLDPETGRKTEERVATGYNYVVKLDHPIRKKFSARERDSYTQDETPTVGKGKGGQSSDHLSTYSLLGHNAHAILGENFGVRSTKNDDYWLAYQAGEVPPPPRIPFVFDKFRNYLTAVGVSTEQHGNTLHYMPLSDTKIREQSNGEIQTARLLRAKDAAEEKGGLFDPDTTGGIGGEHWAHIELGRKMPHPLYEKVVKDLTDMKHADYLGLIAGTRHYDPKTQKFQDEPGDGTLTGEHAFKELLNFDVDTQLDKTKARLKTAVGSDRNRYHRATRYLRGLKETGMAAEDAYMTSVVPVLPPKFRPIAEMKDGSLRVSDSNLLYRDLLLTRNVLDEAEKNKQLSTRDLGKARLSIYDAHAALIGVGKSLTDRGGEDIKGFVEVIRGKNNKQGMFQSMVTRRRNDYTGRSVIEGDASLGPDEIKIPEKMAWKLYAPAIVRRLTQLGLKPVDAQQELEKRTLVARGALDEELKHRPVVYSRAPALHKWSVLAGRPTLSDGEEIRISPLVIGPQNADFDGDTISVHVPLTEKARQEAHQLLPTNNLFYDRDRSVAFAPEKDIITGIFMLTRQGSPSGKTYASRKEAIGAYHDNKDALRMDSLVTVKGESGQQSIGWLIFQEMIPARFRVGLTPPMTKDKLEKVVNSIADTSPGDFNNLLRKISMAGFTYAARSGGATATVKELVVDRSKVNRLLDDLQKEIDKGKTPDEKRAIATKFYSETTKPSVDKMVEAHLREVGSGGAVFMDAKPSSKMGFDSYRQMLASPILVKDVNDRIAADVIRSSYGSGMGLSDYILTTPGARAGMAARALSSALPGFLSKELAGNMSNVRITERDCGTEVGIDQAVTAPASVKQHDADLLDRHLLHDITGTTFKRNDVVTPEMLARLRDRGIKDIEVRSPLTCKAQRPPCQMCAGRAPDGKLHDIGANIGYRYGQAVGERSMQLTMRAFHSGGTVGSGDSLSAGFARLHELLAAPGTIKGQGTLAEKAGHVHDIRKAPQGGWFVDIKDSADNEIHEHYIPVDRKVIVKANQKVEAGDPLSDGSYLPQEIARHKGTLAAQRYVVDEARKAYQVAGATLRKPVLEVAVAGLMRNVEITEDGGEPDLAPGDIIHENLYEARRAKNPRIKARPAILGLSKVPIARSTDLLERLNFQRLEDALREIPSIGGKSDLTGESGSPMAGLAYGVKFREGSFGPRGDKAEFGHMVDSAFDKRS